MPEPKELTHHLRQAEADLGLSRAALSQGMCVSTSDGARLRFIWGLLATVQEELASIRRNHGGDEPPTTPPGSSER